MAATSGPAMPESESTDGAIDSHTEEAQAFNQDMFDKGFFLKLTANVNKIESETINVLAKAADTLRIS